jgi:hypothetical protein
VFLGAVPFAVLALVIAVMMPQVAMRDGSAELDSGPGAGFAMPHPSGETDQLEDLVAGVLKRSGPDVGARVLAAAGTGLTEAQVWGLGQVLVRGWILQQPTITQSAVEDWVGVPGGVLTSFFDGLVDDGLLTREGDILGLAPAGERAGEAIMLAWRDYLRDQLRDWLPADRVESAETDAAMVRVVTRLIRESSAPGRHSADVAARPEA